MAKGSSGGSDAAEDRRMGRRACGRMDDRANGGLGEGESAQTTARNDGIEGCANAVAEFIRDPEAVSKKTEEAIKHLGVGPNRHSVEKLAAQVVAYRIKSRKTNGDSAAGILKQKGLSAAVRAVVEQYEDQH